MKATGTVPLLAVLSLLLACGTAQGRNLSASLAEAEQRVAAAEADVSAKQQQLDDARARYGNATKRAAAPVDRLNDSRAEVQRLRRDLAGEERAAHGRISAIERQRQQEEDGHDEEVRTGMGFGLAALVAALIALAWGWFRATEPVAALTRLELGQAIGLCVGGGLLLVIVGAILGSSRGALGSLGSFIFCLGLVLPTALLLARHSAEVQKGRSRALLRRERLPAWTSLATAGLMFVLFLAGAGSALVADDASSQPVSAQLREEAVAASRGAGAEEMQSARAALATARRRAARPVSRREAARSTVADARGALRDSQTQLVSARGNQRSYSRQLAAQESKEAREAEREAELVAIEEEELAEQEEELASECNPNYSGCLDPNSYDYDCASGSGDGPDYTGTVEVLGYDEYGLDDDGDGIGCEYG
ncbi:MAG TPA: hypothetical protein VFN92_06775 [Solirubrobacterales bacterium]|nr:hypothetical protein [Solirubrobacterales bacterium]